MEAFRSSTTVKVLLLSARVGGVGLNLQMASRMILLDVDWTHGSDHQVMARMDRLGQLNDMIIFRFVIAGHVEHHVYDKQLSKENLAKTLALPPGQIPEAPDTNVSGVNTPLSRSRLFGVKMRWPRGRRRRQSRHQMELLWTSHLWTTLRFWELVLKIVRVV